MKILGNNLVQLPALSEIIAKKKKLRLVIIVAKMVLGILLGRQDIHNTATVQCKDMIKPP